MKKDEAISILATSQRPREPKDRARYDEAVKMAVDALNKPERKTGQWILDRSGAYCCNRCMEPCATYVMMKPRDRFCKMCGAKMEGERKE